MLTRRLTIILCSYAQQTPDNYNVFLCSIDVPQSYCVLIPNRRPAIIPCSYAQSTPHNHTVFLCSIDAPQSYPADSLQLHHSVPLNRHPTVAPFCNTQQTPYSCTILCHSTDTLQLHHSVTLNWRTVKGWSVWPQQIQIYLLSCLMAVNERTSEHLPTIWEVLKIFPIKEPTSSPEYWVGIPFLLYVSHF